MLKYVVSIVVNAMLKRARNVLEKQQESLNSATDAVSQEMERKRMTYLLKNVLNLN
jgi:hypothetical protein